MLKIFIFNLFTLLVSTLLSGCIKEPLRPFPLQIDTTWVATGYYVLNEGLFNQNNSTLTRFSYSDSLAVNDYFGLVNGRGLGDTGNDLAIYGSRVYVVVSGSSQLEVVDARNGTSIKQIPLFDGKKPRQPRKIAFYRNYALVTAFDGHMMAIDTATFTIEKSVKVGNNPEGIVVVGHKAYVANSGGLDFPLYDSTLSVINLTNWEEISRVNVGKNPVVVKHDNNGFVYVVTRGDYGQIKPQLWVVDINADEVVYTFHGLEVFDLAIDGNLAYVYQHDHMAGTGSSVRLVDLQRRQVIRENFITDGTNLTTLYGIAVEPASGNVFLTDAMGFVNTGNVYCFSPEGKLQYSVKAGLNPSTICFIYESD